jgi:hypothetical protein
MKIHFDSVQSSSAKFTTFILPVVLIHCSSNLVYYWKKEKKRGKNLMNPKK